MTPRATLATAAAAGLVAAAACAVALAARLDVRTAVAVTRYALDACAVAAIAVPSLAWLAGDDRRLRAPAIAVAAAWAATAVVLAWLAAAEAAGVSPARVGAGAVADHVTAFAAGRATAVTAVLAVLYVLVAATRADTLQPGPELLVVVAVAGLLPGPLAGHAASGPRHELTTVSVALHAGAAAVWVGGVAALVVVAAARRRLLDAAVARFTRIATGAVLVVAVSGVITAVARFGSVTALVTTGYGVVVLVKAAVLVGLAGVAARVRAARRAPATLIAVEVVLMGVALGLAAALTGAAP